MSIGSWTPTPCFDAGSKYCPCELAVVGQCVACSLLRGEAACNCGWSGVCVYGQFLREGKASKAERGTYASKILRRFEIVQSPGPMRAFCVQLSAPREIASWCVFPGSFVMVRPRGSQERWNVPLCVMDAGEASLTIAVEVVGPKTAALDQNVREGETVTLVAPFWSGIQGLEHLRKRAGGRVLTVAKGINQASLIQVARYVSFRGGSMKALTGPGALGTVFAAGALREAGACVTVLPREKDHNLGTVSSELQSGGYDLLVSAGGQAQHKSLQGLLGSMPAPPAFCWTSNLSMTCAEGICGSCLVEGFRGCKSQLPSALPSDVRRYFGS